jgi:hypothetical protein
MGVKKSEISTAAAIVIKDEGTPVEPALGGMNFTGDGVTATQTAPGQTEVNVPGNDGVGGFPPIALFGDLSPPVNAVAGCSYINTCNVGAQLILPSSPNDGDEVGFFGWYCGGGGCAQSILLSGTKNIVRANAFGICSTQSVFASHPSVLRYSAARDRWEPVQGLF